MPRPRVAMRKIRDVIRLTFGEGLSLRQVGLSLDLPFTTVGDHVRRAKAAGLSWPLPDELSDRGSSAPVPAPPPTSPGRCRTGRDPPELRRKGVTLELLWLEYREAIPTATATPSSVTYYRDWRATSTSSCAKSTAPGRSSSSTSPARRSRSTTDAPARSHCDAELFVAVAGASNYLFAEALRLPGALYWVSAHVHAFEAMGGCHEIVVCDNLRSGSPGRTATSPTSTPPIRRWPPTTASPSSRRGPTSRETRPRSKPACCWPSAGSSPGCATGSSPRSPRPTSRSASASNDQRQAVQEDGRLEARAVRAARPPGATAPSA